MEGKENDFLEKVLNLARRGEGGEKENAIRLLKKICARRDLNFDDVMRGTGEKEFSIECQKSFSKLLLHVIYRYGLLRYSDKVHANYNYTRVFFTTTPDKYAEVCTAFEILRRRYKTEKKLFADLFADAFYQKHDLFYQPTAEEWKKINEEKKDEKISKAEQRRHEISTLMSRGMESVEIYKQLELH